MSAKKPPFKAYSQQQPLGKFDRSILFSCFGTWVESIRLMREIDPERAADAFLTLADYCLYSVEPDPDANPWRGAWASVKSGADASIKNRSRRFGTKDEVKRDMIKQYILAHPKESQRDVRDATGFSLQLINDVAKELKAVGILGGCSSNNNINNNPRGRVLEQNTFEEEPPEWEEVLGPHQPDAQTPPECQEGGKAIDKKETA